MNTILFQSVRKAGCLLAAAAAVALACDSTFGQSISTSWEGLRASGRIPPDVHGAPGPEGVLATVNLQIAYFTKSGATHWGPISLQSFWSSVGNTGSGNSDPKVLFDHDSRRFFVLLQENTGSRFWFNLAVSKNSHPATSSTSDWYFYRLDATEYAAGNQVGGTNYGGDYPGFAVDSQAVYATYRMYAFNPNGTMNGAGSSYTNVSLLIMNKSQLISGSGGLNSTIYFDGFDLQPVTPMSGNPGNVMYMVCHTSPSNLRIYSLSNPLGSPRTIDYQNVSITDRGSGPTNGAPQSGSTLTLDTPTRLLNNATYIDGDIWLCRGTGQPEGPAVAAYYRLRLNGWPSSGSVSVEEDGTVGSGSYWNFCPAIGANVAGEVAMTWTRSSSGTYPTMMYAYRNASDSSFGSAQVVKASPAPSSDIAMGDTIGRWGDYANVWADPIDGSLWIANEWIRSDTGTWSTWWAQVLTPAHDLYVNWDAPFPSIQNGSLSFPYTTVTAAHDNITHGTIHIYGGANYNEQPTFNKSVVLELYSGAPFAIGKP